MSPSDVSRSSSLTSLFPPIESTLEVPFSSTITAQRIYDHFPPTKVCLEDESKSFDTSSLIANMVKKKNSIMTASDNTISTKRVKTSSPFFTLGCSENLSMEPKQRKIVSSSIPQSSYLLDHHQSQQCIKEQQQSLMSLLSSDIHRDDDSGTFFDSSTSQNKHLISNLNPLQRNTSNLNEIMSTVKQPQPNHFLFGIQLNDKTFNVLDIPSPPLPSRSKSDLKRIRRYSSSETTTNRPLRDLTLDPFRENKPNNTIPPVTTKAKKKIQQSVTTGTTTTSTTIVSLNTQHKQRTDSDDSNYDQDDPARKKRQLVQLHQPNLHHRNPLKTLTADHSLVIKPTSKPTSSFDDSELSKPSVVNQSSNNSSLLSFTTVHSAHKSNISSTLHQPNERVPHHDELCNHGDVDDDVSSSSVVSSSSNDNLSTMKQRIPSSLLVHADVRIEDKLSTDERSISNISVTKRNRLLSFGTDVTKDSTEKGNYHVGACPSKQLQRSTKTYKKERHSIACTSSMPHSLEASITKKDLIHIENKKQHDNLTESSKFEKSIRASPKRFPKLPDMNASQIAPVLADVRKLIHSYTLVNNIKCKNLKNTSSSVAINDHEKQILQQINKLSGYVLTPPITDNELKTREGNHKQSDERDLRHTMMQPNAPSSSALSLFMDPAKVEIWHRLGPALKRTEQYKNDIAAAVEEITQTKIVKQQGGSYKYYNIDTLKEFSGGIVASVITDTRPAELNEPINTKDMPHLISSVDGKNLSHQTKRRSMSVSSSSLTTTQSRKQKKELFNHHQEKSMDPDEYKARYAAMLDEVSSIRTQCWKKYFVELTAQQQKDTSFLRSSSMSTDDKREQKFAESECAHSTSSSISLTNQNDAISLDDFHVVIVSDNNQLFPNTNELTKNDDDFNDGSSAVMTAEHTSSLNENVDAMTLLSQSIQSELGTKEQNQVNVNMCSRQESDIIEHVSNDILMVDVDDNVKDGLLPLPNRDDPSSDPEIAQAELKLWHDLDDALDQYSRTVLAIQKRKQIIKRSRHQIQKKVQEVQRTPINVDVSIIGC